MLRLVAFVHPFVCLIVQTLRLILFCLAFDLIFGLGLCVKVAGQKSLARSNSQKSCFYVGFLTFSPPHDKLISEVKGQGQIFRSKVKVTRSAYFKVGL